MQHLRYIMSMLSVRVFPLNVTSCRGERVHKRFIRGSFLTANKVLKGIPGKKIWHLQNEAGGVIVKIGLFFTFNQMGNGFVSSMTWFIIMSCFWKMMFISWGHIKKSRKLMLIFPKRWEEMVWSFPRWSASKKWGRGFAVTQV